MDDATRTIEIERTMTAQVDNTELPGELHEVHRGLRECAQDERCDAVPLACFLDTCAEQKLWVEASSRTYGSLGIAGSELGRPALARAENQITTGEYLTIDNQGCRRALSSGLWEALASHALWAWLFSEKYI